MNGYGNSWEKYPIETGDTWYCGESHVSVMDITNGYPYSTMKADMIYCDCPWNLNILNVFNRKAERKEMRDFKDFYSHLFRIIRITNPEVCYLEIGKENVKLFENNMKLLYKHVDVYGITYYHKNACHLIRGGKDISPYNYGGMDDDATPYMAVAKEKKRIVCDPCMGKGLTALAALENGCTFVGTELNKRKLAAGIEILNRKGYAFHKEL